MKKNKDQNNLTDKARENPWVIATIILGIVTLILLLSNFSGDVTGASVGVASPEEVQQKVVDFVSSQIDGEVELELEDKVHILKQENQIRIFPGQKHRFKSITNDAMFLEVSTHHEDSDSHRIEQSRKLEV